MKITAGHPVEKLSMNIQKSFRVETHTLILRILAEKDIPHLFSATTYAGFNDGLIWEAPGSEDELVEHCRNAIKAWESGEGYSFAIQRKSDGKFLGRISIRKTPVANVWNVGFWTHPEEQGKGIMTEALKAVLAFGFKELHAVKIEALHAVWNKASERVMAKNGLKFERYIEKGFLKNGKWVAQNLLSIERKQ
jgi:RimJ/RimL family protein N-acetyltransferase